MSLYILDKSGEKPVLCDDWGKWTDWFENYGLRRVGLTVLDDGKIIVSTVFLGVDHGLSPNPVLWETMVFQGDIGNSPLDYDRCTGTREQALAMHEMMCAQMQALLNLELEFKT